MSAANQAVNRFYELITVDQYEVLHRLCLSEKQDTMAHTAGLSIANNEQSRIPGENGSSLRTDVS